MEARRKVLETEVVRDKNGIRRFHGAFTGGFSAGYWNSVGTEEGWTPSQFVSARKAADGGAAPGAAPAERRPQDYMDEEDDPMLSNTLKTKKEYDTLGAALAVTTDARAPIPGPIPLDFLIPSTNPVGKTLLRTMGWREGQGVGPRLTAAEKGYDEELAGSHTFAPENVKTQSILVKNDRYGLGYTPSIRAQSRGNKSQFLKMSDVLKGGYASTTGFGLGALEVDDDLDVYGTDDMSNYDIELKDPGQEEKDARGGAKRRPAAQTALSARLASGPSSGIVLEGFLQAKKKDHRPHRYKVAPAPPDWYPKHKFTTPLVVPNVRRRPLPVLDDGKAPSADAKVLALERREALVPLSKVTLPEFKLKFLSEKDIVTEDKKKESLPTLPERTVTVWRPEGMLCRRMNVPNPFQGLEGTPDNAAMQEIMDLAGVPGQPVSMLDLIEAYDPNKHDPLLESEERPNVDLFKEIFG